MNTPPILHEFLDHLIVGHTSKTKSDIKRRRIESIEQDIVYAASGSNVKPSKHLITGIAFKSMTGSRKIVDILNRLGHSVSYNTAEELETELTFSSLENNRTTPAGMSLSPTLCTGVAFDNFDRYVETLTGKDTLHDTVGIAYHDIPFADINQSNVFDDTVENIDMEVSRKRRRRFESEGLDLEPYRKKPKMRSSTLIPLLDYKRQFIPSSLEQARLLDMLWMMSLHYLPRETPMWVGWNSRVQPGEDTCQKVWYLPQIDLSPTSNTVVAETLNVAQRIAKDTERDEISVTYDLAIAKLAMQIQAAESPRYDNVFVLMGAFHTEMTFFNALGKFIAE